MRLSEQEISIEARRWGRFLACIWRIGCLWRGFGAKVAGDRDLGAACWMMVSNCVFGEHEREGEYFEDVPFGNV